MAAFTYGISTRMGRDLQGRIRDHFSRTLKGLSPQQKEEKAQSKDAAAMRKALQEMIALSSTELKHTARKLTLPHDYQYDDAKPKDSVSPAPIFGNTHWQLGTDNKVDAYGKWLTSPKTPALPRSLPTGCGKRFSVGGLVEPTDDWRDDTQASIPELLDHLEKLMIRVDYDLREFQRVLLSVKAFGREATHYEVANDQPYYFEGPLLSRMSAEQLWDSFVSLSVPYADERVRDPNAIKEKLSRFCRIPEKNGRFGT